MRVEAIGDYWWRSSREQPMVVLAGEEIGDGVR